MDNVSYLVFQITWYFQIALIALESILFGYRIWINKQGKSLNIYIRICSTMYITFYAMFFILTTPEFVDISMVFYAAAYISAQLLMIKRLYSTFENTVFALSKYSVFIYGLTVVITSILWIGACFCIYFRHQNNMYYQWASYQIWIILGIKSIFTMVLITEFGRKLLNLVMSESLMTPSITTTNSKSMNNINGYNKSIEIGHIAHLSDKQQVLLSVIARHTVLSVVILILCELYLTPWIIFIEQLDPMKVSHDKQFVIYVQGNYIIIIQIFCVYLSMLGSDTKLYSIFCKLCDKLCLFCLNRHIRRRIIMEQNDINSK